MNIRHLQLRLYRLTGGKIVNFLHIGKTGGMAIKKALRPNLKTDKHIIHLRGHTCTLRDIPQGDKVFFVLRDPIKKFVSGFNHQKRQIEIWSDPWTPGEKVAFSHFNTPNELAIALGSEDRERRELAMNSMRSIEHVRDSFWDWFETEEYFISRLEDILYIGFQESLEEDFANLKKILHLPENAKLPQNDKEANKTPSHFDKFLDEQAKAYLRLWYRRDYEFLELCHKKISEINAVH